MHIQPKYRPLIVLAALAVLTVVVAAFRIPAMVRAAEAGVAGPLALNLALTVAGELPVHELELEADAGLEDLVRALAALAAVPLPPGSALPVAPVAATGAWSTVGSLNVDLFTDLEANPGHVLQVLMVELENRDDRTHALPHVVADDPMAAFDRDADRLDLQAVGLDGRGRRHPAAAVLCGEQARLVPGGRLPCRLVWQVPDGLELAAVELVVPARLQLPVGEAE